MALLYIHWNPDPILFSIAGIAIRWYSIFWVIAILAGSQVVYKLYQSKGLPVDTFQNLFLYSFLGIFIGARLGHCLFYEPDYYLSHPLEIVLPVHFYPDGDWKFTGYAGLASHGGTLGLIIALAIFCRKTKIHYLDILDMMGIAAPLAAGFIRLANLMNSEIIGLPTDVPWAFVFERVDMLPRHPAQLYEARFLLRVVYYFDIFVPLLYRILEGAAGGFRECIAYRYGADIEYPVCLVGAIFRNHEAEESGSIGGRARVVVREISKEFLRVLFSNRSYRRAVSLLRRWGADNCR